MVFVEADVLLRTRNESHQPSYVQRYMNIILSSFIFLRKDVYLWICKCLLKFCFVNIFFLLHYLACAYMFVCMPKYLCTAAPYVCVQLEYMAFLIKEIDCLWNCLAYMYILILMYS